MYSKSDIESAANELADWIIEQVSCRNSLDQATAIAYAHARFGDTLLRRDEKGSVVLDLYVVETLQVLGAGRIVWEEGARRWRRRVWYETGERQAA